MHARAATSPAGDLHDLDPDPFLDERAAEAPRRYYVLDDTGFDEVPARYRRFYRRWRGEDDRLAPNEARCPTCAVVIRARRELRAGDELYCMPCAARLAVLRAEAGGLAVRAIG
jgi:hypothetical protein